MSVRTPELVSLKAAMALWSWGLEGEEQAGRAGEPGQGLLGRDLRGES